MPNNSFHQHPCTYRFGQLEQVNTDSVEPALRAATKHEVNMLRPDTVQEFEQRYWDWNCAHQPVPACMQFPHPTEHACPTSSSIRNRCRESLMKEMPEMEGPYVKVPKVF